jgi:hypothetical protein
VILMKPLLDIFFQPGKVFDELPSRLNAWILPLILNVLLVVATTALPLHFIGMENIVRQRLEQMNLSPEQMQVAVSRASTQSPVVNYLTGGIGIAIGMAIIAGVLFAFGLMTKREPKYPSVLAMVSLSFFPYFLITGIMTALIILATPDKSSLDATNLVATNVGAYVNREGTPKGLYSLYTSLDVLSFLEIGLLSLGFSRLTRAGYFAGLAAVGGLWVLYVSSKMAISLLF